MHKSISSEYRNSISNSSSIVTIHPKDIDQLALYGFVRPAAENALMECNNQFQDAFEFLEKELFQILHNNKYDDPSNGFFNLWRPPLLIRIGTDVRNSV